MAKVDWETSESDEFRIIQSMERILEQHQQELLVKLETWADRVAAPSAPRFLVSKRSGQSKLCDEALPEPSLMHHKNKSYDEARLTHVQVVEATQGLGKFNEDERDAIKDTSLWQSLRQWSRELMGSMPASLFFAGLIVTNSIFLGVQLEMQAASENIFVEDTFFLALNVVYAVLFTMEVMLRLLGSGCSMFIWSSHDWAWNCLDLFVVVSSWVELLLHSLEGNSSISGNRNLRMLRLLRFGRLVRVVRVVRVARLFRSLRTLINSLVGTLKSLFWSLLLLALIMYMFGIMFTDAVLDHRNSLGFTDAGSDLSLRFGSLYLSIETLFRAISNGLTWGEAADALARMDHGMFWCSLFHFYVAFCSFAVLNVMTGTFCNAAIKAAERDHDMLVLSLVQTRQELREQVATLFHKIDQRGVGQVTIDDFEQHFSDDVVIAFFESLEIGAMDAWTLFLSLDVDGDHTISVDEFTERCLQLHGPARSADIFALRQNTDKLADYLIKVEGRQLQLHQRFNELLRTMSSVGYLTEPVKEAEL